MKKNKETIVPAIVAILILLLWFVNWLLLSGKNDRGTFGDMFGAVNALFSGFALAGVIYAIILQKQELGHQREELKLTRDELKGQKEQLEAQVETMQLQKFENTFFQLISLQNEIVKMLEWESYGSKPAKGRRVLESAYWDFRNLHNKSLNDGISESFELVSTNYQSSYKDFSNDTSQYFHNLKILLKLIEKQAPPDDTDLYASIVRSQLSDVELALIYYHSISLVDGREFERLVNKYFILENMPKDLLVLASHYEQIKRRGSPDQ